MTMGQDIPAASSDFQRTFSPVSGSHLSMRPVSREMRFCSGPRQLGQSIASRATETAESKVRVKIEKAAKTIPAVSSRRACMVGSVGVVPEQRDSKVG